jgi:anti-sigma factor RsiW
MSTGRADEGTMITCEQFVTFLMDYLDEMLPADQRATFEAHLAICPSCVNYLATYRQTVELGRSLCASDQEAVPDEVPEALVRAVLAARRSRG